MNPFNFSITQNVYSYYPIVFYFSEADAKFKRMVVIWASKHNVIILNGKLITGKKLRINFESKNNAMEI